MQTVITKPIHRILTENFAKSEQVRNNIKDYEQDTDFEPALKLFCPWGAATWLITELDPQTNIAYGLAYLGGASPELGLISINELATIRHPSGLRVERDIYFSANGRLLSQYAKEARELGYIAA